MELGGEVLAKTGMNALPNAIRQSWARAGAFGVADAAAWVGVADVVGMCADCTYEHAWMGGALLRIWGKQVLQLLVLSVTMDVCVRTMRWN